MTNKNTAELAPRFGIAEWYGFSFTELTPGERKTLATFEPDKSKRLNKAERERLATLEAKSTSGKKLTDRETDRLNALRLKNSEALATNKPCPFKGMERDALCTKEGGVCSIRLYEEKNGVVKPVTGERGGFRALCPYRFHENLEVFKRIGEKILGDPQPGLVGEVGFLESAGTVDGEDGEDVGRIDMVLVSNKNPANSAMRWCAVEIQAVYFSGEEMGKEFKAIAAADGKLTFPTKNRRPDYRSSGPKRLMPQLQIKVPTLRRWGKKMAVVVDRDFFDSIGEMDNVDDISNSDIAWFIVRFDESNGKQAKLVRDEVRFTTLERAVEGLTGGTPVALEEFEKRIQEKLDTPGGTSAQKD